MSFLIYKVSLNMFKAPENKGFRKNKVSIGLIQVIDLNTNLSLNTIYI